MPVLKKINFVTDRIRFLAFTLFICLSFDFLSLQQNQGLGKLSSSTGPPPLPLPSFSPPLLVINTNLPPMLHHFQVTVKFSLARGEYLRLTLSLGVGDPCQYRRRRYNTKTRFFGLHFCCRNSRCIFNHFYIIRPKSYRIR